MLICYTEHNFRAKNMRIVEKANEIIGSYEAQGFKLTLRQLYYQFVAQDLLQNNQKSYDNLGGIVKKAREAGLISLDAIEDRTRWLRNKSHWNNPQQILNAAIKSYEVDKWENQLYRPEVWIEKDALVGVIERVCEELDVPYFSCRGFGSLSELWRAGQRFKRYIEGGQRPLVIHLGDHDPSGIDMTRDNAKRLSLFAENTIQIQRIALNHEQVEEYSPPPNQAKKTDSRARGYIEKYGASSWELDALDPSVIVGLVRDAIDSVRDQSLWQEAEQREKDGRVQLEKLVGYL